MNVDQPVIKTKIHEGSLIDNKTQNQVYPETQISKKLAKVELSYQKKEQSEEIGEFSQSSSISFMIKHSYRDVHRKKFHFCLSFCSVFVVVWSALIINTVVEKGPIIFLKLAQSEEGQFDGFLSPTNEGDGVFLNFTKITEVTKDKFNLSPRKYFDSVKLVSDDPLEIRKDIGGEEYL